MKTPLEVIQSLSIQFGFDADFKQVTHDTFKEDLEGIKALLADRILYLLRNDHTTLFNILYRIDIKEELVKKALTADFIQDAAGKLAELVLERQLQKYINKKAGKL